MERLAYLGAALLSLALAPGSSTAAVQWRTNGAIVCDAPGDQLGLDATSDGAGGLFAVWTDERSAGSIAVYLQHLDPEGSPVVGWPAQGLLLNANPYLTFNGRGNMRVVSDGSGGAIAVWMDRRHHPGSCTWNLYAQRVTAAGSLLWGIAGTPIIGDSSAYGYSCFDLLADGAGGALVTWEAGCIDSQTDARVQHLSATGLPQWGVTGVAVESDPSAQGFCPQLASDGAGGVFVGWTGQASDPNYEAKLQHLDAGGRPLWVSPIPPSRSGLGNGRLLPDGSGGVIMAGRYTSQRISGSGAYLWPSDGPGETYRACRDGAGGFIGVRLSGATTSVHRISNAGSCLWSRALWVGALLPAVPVEDGAGGAVIAMNVADTTGDVFATRVTSAGTVVAGWEGTPVGRGVAVCVAAGQQQNAMVVPGSGGTSLVLWEDHRSDNWDIYAARLGADGVVPALASFVSAETSSEMVRLTWWTPNEGPISVYRSETEGSWTRRATLWPDGNDQVRYEDRDVEPGTTYGYRLGILDEAGVERFVGETTIAIPSNPTLALQGVWPNPSRGEIQVSFSVPEPAPVTFELVDPSGRLIEIHPAIPGRGGSDIIALRTGSTLKPGLYLVRLRQGVRSTSRKVCVVR